MTKPATIAEIIRGAKKYLPKLNEKRVMQAYEFASKAHEGQKRNSGEPYIQHPLEVAKILISLQPDEDSIISSLLHDVPEDTKYTIEDLKKEFGEKVVPLLTGLEKLGKVYYRGEERQIENLRKMFIAMAKDIRVILIKLADRLHNMRTLSFVPDRKQERIARETLMVYAPIAGRLGIYAIKNELEDLCFKYLEPQNFKRIQKEMKELMGVQQNVIRVCKCTLKQTLKKAGIEAEVEGRIKHAYSILRKLKRKDKNYVSELYDVLALRIVVKDEAECYQALGIIHKNWTPMPRRFKDYIAVPKPNGYQSLHTTLVGLCPDIHGQPIEVQIRTKEMDLVAKYGIAAHWQYKEEKGRSIAVAPDKLNWVQGLVELHESLKSNSEFIESLNMDLFRDRIFVLTPKGDVLDLPVNATPVDFAYAIHSDVGNRCKGAKVNGQIAPLNQPLKNGQVVEILTSPNTEPNRYWLSFVVTSQAKQRIKYWFNSQDKDHLTKTGKELINEQLKRYGEKPLDPTMSALKNLDGEKLTIKEREAILEKVGNMSIDVVTLAKKLIPEAKRKQLNQISASTASALAEGVKIEKKDEVLITGERGYKTQLATCCQPKPGDLITGYITRGKGVTVHQQKCKMLKGLNQERLIKTSWSSDRVHEFEATLVLERRSRIGLLRDVAEVFAGNHLPILDLQNIRREGTDVG
ncbi:MAG: bifunctional (p)ppGpp synthetase/guanosine-3',5'-bis(diphosphate) 3'-pyrophosphohydrolase, partial [Candidatus Peregrinibacteria bacterium]